MQSSDGFGQFMGPDLGYLWISIQPCYMLSCSSRLLGSATVLRSAHYNPLRYCSKKKGRSNMFPVSFKAV